MLGRVHRETTEAPMSEMGQKHALPRRSIDFRFAPNKQTRDVSSAVPLMYSRRR